jgi:cyclohexanecarboxylate-CoA ligase
LPFDQRLQQTGVGMACKIYLPQTRIDGQQALWPNTLPIVDLDAAVARNPEREAIVGWNSVEEREVRLTYAELAGHVDRIAAGLLQLGIRKGDVVAFQLPNWWQFVALFYACVRIGAVANPLMPIFRQRELSYMLNFSEAKLVVVPQTFRNFNHAALLAEIKPDLPKLEHVVVVGG